MVYQVACVMAQSNLISCDSRVLACVAGRPDLAGLGIQHRTLIPVSIYKSLEVKRDIYYVVYLQYMLTLSSNNCKKRLGLEPQGLAKIGCRPFLPCAKMTSLEKCKRRCRDRTRRRLRAKICSI